MKKKALSILLSLLFVIGMMPISVQAQGIPPELTADVYLNEVFSQMRDSFDIDARSNASISVTHARYLYDFANQPIAILYEFYPKGYAIYDFESSIVLEYSKDSNHPFYTQKDVIYYYDGVFGYYASIGNNFVNLATGAIADVSRSFGRNNFYHSPVGTLVEESLSRASEGPVYLVNSTRMYNCNRSSNFDYFYRDFTAEELVDIPGVCGSVACAIMVAYYDDHESSLAGSGDFVLDWKKTAGSIDAGTYGLYLVDEFIPLVEPSGNGSIFLNPGMSSYLSNHGINGGCSLGLLAVYQQTKNAIGTDGTGVPLIVGTSNHYCVGIGYKNIDGKQIFVNNGWGSTSWINASTVINTWTMYFN